MLGCFKKRADKVDAMDEMDRMDKGKQPSDGDLLLAVVKAQSAMIRPDFCVELPAELLPPGPLEVINCKVRCGDGLYPWQKNALNRIVRDTAEERATRKMNRPSGWINTGDADQAVVG